MISSSTPGAAVGIDGGNFITTSSATALMVGKLVLLTAGGAAPSNTGGPLLYAVGRVASPASEAAVVRPGDALGGTRGGGDFAYSDGLGLDATDLPDGTPDAFRIPAGALLTGRGGIGLMGFPSASNLRGSTSGQTFGGDFGVADGPGVPGVEVVGLGGGVDGGPIACGIGGRDFTGGVDGGGFASGSAASARVDEPVAAAGGVCPYPAPTGSPAYTSAVSPRDRGGATGIAFDSSRTRGGASGASLVTS